jgi:hypothetical protein
VGVLSGMYIEQCPVLIYCDLCGNVLLIAYVLMFTAIIGT